MNCLFCTWLGEKNQIVWENENVVVFVANLAFTKGHLLVCPKKHVESIFDLNDKFRGELYSVSLKMGKLLQEKLNVGSFTLGENEKLHLVDPQVKTHIPHIHMHVIPRRHGEQVFDKERVNLSKSEVLELIRILKS